MEVARKSHIYILMHLPTLSWQAPRHATMRLLAHDMSGSPQVGLAMCMLLVAKGWAGILIMVYTVILCHASGMPFPLPMIIPCCCQYRQLMSSRGDQYR